MIEFASILSVLLSVECHEACPNTDPFPIRVVCAWFLTCPFELHNGYTCFEYVSGTGDLIRNIRLFHLGQHGPPETFVDVWSQRGKCPQRLSQKRHLR